jgi:hypothetical protein
MIEYGIIYYTGDVFRVAFDQHEPVERPLHAALPLDVVMHCTYIADLNTGRVLKDRNNGCVHLDPTVRNVFMSESLLSPTELWVELAKITTRTREMAKLDKKIREQRTLLRNLEKERETYD